MTTVKDGLYEYGGVKVGGLLSQGQSYHIKPGSGLSGAGGLKINDAVATVAQAHTLMTADQNDVAYMYAEDNSASGTTDYQSSTLTWSKDGTHLVGVNSGCALGQRSRIAQLSTATAVSPLVTWSANNSSMRGIHIFHGVADADSKICFSVTGDRNYFAGCHFGGIGNATMDVADAMDLQLTGGENLFEDCVIGIDTVGRSGSGDAQYGVSLGGERNIFRNCTFLALAEADTYSFLYAAASSIDRWILFDNCMFINSVGSTGTTMAQAFDITGTGGSPAGLVVLRNCSAVGVTALQTGGSSDVYIDNGGSPAGNASGIAVVLA
jgi:hypothetical protein